MSGTPAAIESSRLGGELIARPYEVSWIDRFTDSIERLPGSRWLYYLIIWLVPVAAMVLTKWADGTYSPPYVSPFHVALASGAAYIAANIAFLDHVAGKALATFRPTSTLTEDQYEAFEYRLTTLPARPTLLWTLVPLVLIVVGMGSAILFDGSLFSAEVEVLALFTSPLSSVIDGVLFFAWIPLLGVWYYHTYHQLKVVDELYVGYTKIDLFYLKPLYSFSRLTAYTAVSLLIPTFCGPATVPSYLDDPVFLADIAVFVGVTIIAIAIFIWPLLGIHRLLVEEKEKLLLSSAKRIQSAISEFDRRIDTGELQAMDKMKATLDGLVTKQSFIDQIPTWPWSTDTSRLVATAVALPVFLYAIQRLIEIIFRT